MDEMFVKDIEDISKTSWSKINSDKFLNDRMDFLAAMQLKGFKVYDANRLDFNGQKHDINIIDYSFKLEKGDIIVRKGHVHIYLGNSMLNADNFGWGKVSRSYPAKYNYYLENGNDSYYVICDHDKKKNGEYNHYTRIYRYVGGEK